MMTTFYYRPTKRAWARIESDGRTHEHYRAVLLRSARLNVLDGKPPAITASGEECAQAALSIATLPAWQRYNAAHRAVRGRRWPWVILQASGHVLVTESEAI